MKRALTILPALAAVAIGGVLVAAQEEKAMPEMSLVVIEHVKPSMTKQYEEATKEMCALLTEHHADPQRVGFFCVSGPELGHVFIMPLPDGFSSMKSTRESWMAAIESIGKERWKAVADKADACVDSRSMVHSVFRADLSYEPEHPSIKEEEIKFAQYDFLYTYPNKTEAFEEIAKEWKALYEKHGIAQGWHVYEQITGEDLPVYLVAKVARSAAEYHTTRADVQKTLGEEGKALSERSSVAIRKVESQVGYPRPDLSYPTMTGE